MTRPLESGKIKKGNNECGFEMVRAAQREKGKKKKTTERRERIGNEVGRTNGRR